MTDRKKDHIKLAFESQIKELQNDTRFYYEPLLGNFKDFNIPQTRLANKTMPYPIWISSMTGGTDKASNINKNLARVAGEFGFGMGLGSCRIILKNHNFFKDFDVRQYLGNNLPLFANLGIAQVEGIIKNNEFASTKQLLADLQADGLIIHINPLQEWIQPEGDLISHNPLDTIKEFMCDFKLPLIVKEVGQGFGPESLKALLQLPLEAIETASFGGTNFSKVEIWRRDKNDRKMFEALSNVGHTNTEIIQWINHYSETNLDIQTKKIIYSGAIQNFLDGYYFIKTSQLPAIYGQASAFLKYAVESYESLRHYAEIQTKGLQLAYNILKMRKF